MDERARRADGELLFPGILPLALAGTALVRRARTAWFYAAAAAVLVVLSLGPEATIGGRAIALPYAWLQSVPPFDSMRHPFTFAAVGLFLIAVLAGLGWSRLPFASRPWAGPAVLALDQVATVLTQSLARIDAIDRHTDDAVLQQVADGTVVSKRARGQLLVANLTGQ